MAVAASKDRDLSRSGTNWHTRPVDEVLRELTASDAGLSQQEAQRRLRTYGPNELPHEPPATRLQILWRQFQNPLIYLLAGAACVSIVVGDVTDAGFIAAVLAINALIGGYQEWRAEQHSQALQQMLKAHASALRDAHWRELDADQLVPGDIVALESGNRVPADLRLLSAHELKVDESLLTGESLPADKNIRWTGDAQASLGDRLNMVFAGTVVARGRASGVVVATAGETQVGQLAIDVMSSKGGQAPLVHRMERFSRAVAVVVLVAAVLVGAVGVLGRGHTVMEMFFFTVALAVSAIPEGLPASMTVTLAVATRRMARRGVIVRRLAAVEGLGSCTLIASDKTGTLTANELTVRVVELGLDCEYEVTGLGFVPEGQVRRDGAPCSAADDETLAAIARIASLCNEGDLELEDDGWHWRGDPADVAMLTLARKLGVDRTAALASFPPVRQIPFESERRFAAGFHRRDGALQAFVKGAPERVLQMCAHPSEDLSRWTAVSEDMARRGYRVLALADGPVDESVATATQIVEPSGLTFRGFVGMIDPLREGVREAIAECHAAGVDVWMVTGDHPITALAIARELGLASGPEQVVTGPALAQATPEERPALIRGARVFARVEPRQKLELVEAARQQGHFVAVTGDGVNDAPALRAANIGVAMGRAGTDVAREAAELVISDDNFATIVAGIEEGRIAYDNVRKVIFLLISTGAAELVAIGLSMFIGLPLALLPVQLLWLNLVTNGIQGVALAFEPGEGDVLRRPPRPPGENIFNRLMIERTIVAALVMGGVTLATFYVLLERGWSEPAARNIVLLLMVLFENIHVYNCRSETKSAFAISPWRSPLLMAGVVAAFGVHVIAMHVPLTQRVLQTGPVDWQTWLTMIGLALTILVAMELDKLWWRLRHGGAQAT